MLKDLPEEEFGPRIDFREYTFLENPSLPKQVTLCCLQAFHLYPGNKMACPLIVSVWSIDLGERVVS